MKKIPMFLSVVLGLMLPTLIFAQQTSIVQTGASPKKFALVIGNSAYVGLTPLPNPVNDANDVAAALEYIGFEVDTVLNGNMIQIEDAITRLKDKLSKDENAYGFFFYAGHGVQSGGENFLIPVDADIPSENYLRNRAVSVQVLLDELNDARNGLNVVVLDACRDNPFGWNRSLTRGLAIITRQPADSIIVYSTSAGQQAADGTGRNGLFTSQLLPNLLTPGLEVKEVFNRTGADVSEVSQKRQIPAIYNQFFGTAFLGEKPTGQENNINTARPQIIIGGAKPESDPDKFWSVGASVGSSFTDPLVIGTVRGTLAPFKYSFLELGMDVGFVTRESNTGYNSFLPFVHADFIWPFTEKIGVYAGAGGGYMWANYDFPEGKISDNTFAADALAGINLFDMLDISYTLRTNFKNMISKVSAGYTYRFK